MRMKKVTPISLRSDRDGRDLIFDAENVTTANIKDINKVLNATDDWIDVIEEKGCTELVSHENEKRIDHRKDDAVI